jgi:ATP-dependent DNA ligase
VLKAITRIAFEAIAAAAAKLKARSFTLDGEVVVAGADGIAVFDALHRRGRVTDAILQAFDLLELDGVDYRPLPLDKRKDGLANLLARARVGIALNQHTDENGAVVFLLGRRTWSLAHEIARCFGA